MKAFLFFSCAVRFGRKIGNKEQEKKTNMGRACHNLTEVVADILRIVDDDKTELLTLACCSFHV